MWGDIIFIFETYFSQKGIQCLFKNKLIYKSSYAFFFSRYHY
jgi:hypothetical protein